MLVLLTHSIALPVLKIIRKKKAFLYSIEQLSALPYETVGNELWQALNENNLHLLPYYEKHDISSMWCYSTRLLMKAKYVCSFLCWQMAAFLFLY